MTPARDHDLIFSCLSLWRTLHPLHGRERKTAASREVFRNVINIYKKYQLWHFKILSSSLRCNSVFQSTPLVAFRLTDNLSDILVRSKLRTDQQTNVTMGSFRCAKNCTIDGRTNCSFSATGEMRTIHDDIDCTDTLSTLQPLGGGGGGYLRKFNTGRLRPRSNPLPFHIPFWRKRYLFYIPFIEERYPFHIPALGSLVLIFM